MPVKTPTQWSAPSGTGYITSSSNANIGTQNDINLCTQSGIDLIIQPQQYSTKFQTSWVLGTRNKTQWQPPSGQGYVINNDTENIVTNNGNTLVTNLGDSIVTTTTHTVSKYATAWTASGV